MTTDERHPTWATSNRFVPRTFVRPLLRFKQVEAASGILLLAAAAIALVWANSPWADTYRLVFEETSLVLNLGPIHLNEPLGTFINEALMAVFFFVVGLEIKRELVLGDLRQPRAALFPVIAAFGGMLVPALIFLWFASGVSPEAMRGWGIPMATDIAFVVGIMALLGSRVPPAAKLFVLALAIVDDLAAIAVVAVFYTNDTRPGWLMAAVIGLGVVWVSQRVGIRSLGVYVPLALFVWYATLESGVHATLAGVALGFLTPARALYSATEFETKARYILDSYPIGHTVEAEEKLDHEAELIAEIATESIAPLNRLESRLLPWSSFLIVPLFALANAGVQFGNADLSGPDGLVAGGVATGLVVGKLAGITLFSWLAVRFGLGRLPPDTTWGHVVGLAAAAGIGFTVSLFVTDLAFGHGPLADAAKIGIFGGSIVAGLIGVLILSRVGRRT